MGSDTNRFIVLIMVFYSFFTSILGVGGSNSHDPKALNALFMHYANQTLNTNHSGSMHQVSLPSNFSGMEVSVIRLRSGSLWGRGTDSRFVKIPPRVRTLPYVKRVVIVYDNLGEWSSKYYQVPPGYSLVSPVIGFKVYDYSDVTTLRDGNFTLSIDGEPISVRFPHLEGGGKNSTRLKCVEFRDGGSVVEFKNMTERNVCVAQKTGHFCLVRLSMPPGKKTRVWRWWVIGFAIGVVGLAASITVGVIVLKLWRKMKIKRMEKEAESSVALDTFWVRPGDHKMPSASMIRTQPTLEHDYVP